MSQQSDAQLTTQAEVIRDETAEGSNSKTRIYSILQNIIDSKINNADLHFLGLYASSGALTTAHPTASPGDYAYVDAGAANPVEMWLWDNDDSQWQQSGSGPVSQDLQSVLDADPEATLDALTVTRFGIELNNDDQERIIQIDEDGPSMKYVNGADTLEVTVRSGDLSIGGSIAGINQSINIGDGITLNTPTIDKGDDSFKIATTEFVRRAAPSGLEAADATGTAISFAVPQIYGSPGSPESGNITLVATGLVKGIVQVLYHQNGTEPTYPAEFVKLGGTYSTTVLNTYYMHAVSATRIGYTISQDGGAPSNSWTLTGNVLTGDAVLGGSSGAFGIGIQTNGVTRHAISATGTQEFTQSAQAASNDFITFTQAVHTSGVARGLVWTGGAHTGSTASTEHIDLDFNLSGTITKATGAISTQRSVLFRGRTFTAPAGSLITNYVNVEVSPPVLGTNVTATNIHSIRSTGGWITAQQTATTTQGFRLEQGSNVAVWTYQGSNVMRLTSVQSMNIGPTSTGVLTLSSARSISYMSDLNQVSIANAWTSTNTVGTANKTFADFAASWSTVPAGDNKLMHFNPSFVETAAVASNYYALDVTGTLNFGASPTGNYYGLRVHPTITGGTLNSILGYGIVVDSALLKNGFGVTPTAVVHLGAGTATANTAPLKFTSGTNLTTAEAGAMEYNGADFFATKSGTTRGTVLISTAATTETVVSDTTLTITHNGVTYKLLAVA